MRPVAWLRIVWIRSLLPFKVYRVMNAAAVKRVMEAALLSAAQPLREADLRRLFPEAWQVGAQGVASALAELRTDWAGRGVELVQLAGGWRFQTAPDMAVFLERLHPERAPRYSRAVLETLAIIAYRQPVTRGDIEAIRGVAVASAIMKTLEDRGWIETVGFKEVVGRPALWATTAQFLDDLSLTSLQDLPPLDVVAAPSTEVRHASGGAEAQALPASQPVKSSFATFSDGQPEL